MDTSVPGRWFRDGPWHDATGIGRAVQAALEDTEAMLRTSARRLRACGQEDGARRAERFAAWARFDLDEPLVARKLYAAAARLRRTPRGELIAGQALEEGLALARADRGNVQLADPESGALKIIAQHGFDEAFLAHFAVVDDDGSACGRAARRTAQLVITDVITDPGFEPHREIAVASGFRAVQSTPLVNRAGHLVGMLSTHYPRPTTLPRRDLQIVSRFGALAGESLSTLLNGAQADGFLPR